MPVVSQSDVLMRWLRVGAAAKAVRGRVGGVGRPLLLAVCARACGYSAPSSPFPSCVPPFPRYVTTVGASRPVKRAICVTARAARTQGAKAVVGSRSATAGPLSYVSK